MPLSIVFSSSQCIYFLLQGPQGPPGLPGQVVSMHFWTGFSSCCSSGGISTIAENGKVITERCQNTCTDLLSINGRRLLHVVFKNSAHEAHYLLCLQLENKQFHDHVYPVWPTITCATVQLLSNFHVQKWKFFFPIQKNGFILITVVT